jgi:ricin-type beta-trefoil lectin protein
MAEQGTVYGGRPPRDWWLIGAGAFLAVAVVVGASLFVYGLITPDHKAATVAPPAAVSASPSPSPVAPSPVAPSPVDSWGPGQPRPLRAKSSSQCLDLQPNVAAEGQPTIQSACTGGTIQQWTATLLAGTADTYTFTNGSSAKCLDVNGESKDDGAVVLQWTCKGSANQQWKVSPGAGGFALVSVNSGKCATVAASGAVLQQTCTGAPNQLWF